MKNNYLIIFLFILSILSSEAQIKFERITSDNGLSQSTVSKIYQDKKNFLWISTADGLNKYDGKNFTIFRHSADDTLSISSNDVNGLFEDSKGNFWVGTRSGGLNLYNPVNEKFFHFTKADDGSDISQYSIGDFIEKNDTLWATAYQKGIISLSLRNFKIHKYYFPVTTGQIDFDALLKDHSGDVWFAARSGMLIKWGQKKNFKIYNLSAVSSIKLHINCLLEDSKNNFYIGTKGQGIFLFNKATGLIKQIFYREDEFEGLNIITHLYEDRHKNLWIGTDRGILIAKKGNFNNLQQLEGNVNKEGSLSSHAVTYILGDKNDNIWVGLWEAGLNVYYPHANQFSNYVYKPGTENTLLTNKITGVVKDIKGNLLIATGIGLTIWKKETDQYRHLQSLPNKPSALPGNDINNLFTDENGNIYISIWNHGLFLKKTISEKFLPVHEKDSFTNKVSAISEGSRRKIWIGTYSGNIFQFDPLTMKLTNIGDYSKGNFILKNIIPAIVEDEEKNLWIGSYFGIWKYNLINKTLKQYTPFPSQGSLSDNHISCIFKDSKKRLWIGTYGGLSLYKKEKDSFENFTKKDGLPNEVIKSIREDNKGNFWIATNLGLCKFNYEKKQTRAFNELDGQKGREFIVNSSYKDENGFLYFGSMQGLIIFHPDSIKETQNDSKIYITTLKLFNKPVVAGEKGSPLEKNITDTKLFSLRYKDAASITFDFVALNFQNGQRSQYAYRMLGFNDNWNYSGHQSSATYTNLSPGEYTFIVKTIYGEGKLSNNSASVKFTILPPFYLSNIALITYLVLVLVMFYAFRKFIKMKESFKADIRIKAIEAENIRKLDEVKTDFFTNISHELRTPLTLIVSPLSDLISGKHNFSPALQNKFQLMHRNGERLLRLINQLLNLSKIESVNRKLEVSKGDIIAYIEKIISSFAHLAGQQNISLVFKSDFKTMDAFFDADIIEKCLYNLLSNAFKFTPEGGEISIICQIETTSDLTANKLKLTLTDSGIGIPENEISHLFERFHTIHGQEKINPNGTGIGLFLTKELIELHKGSIKVSSIEGKGTSFQLIVPVGESYFERSNIYTPQLSVDFNETIGTAEDYNGLETENILSLNKFNLMLIVEDNEELRAYLKESMLDNFEIIEADNGKTGLEKALENQPDIIISDWMMPLMNGIELCQQIKTNETTSHIPFILLTARANTSSMITGIKTGADDYVTKPFDLNLLKAKSNALILNRKMLREKFSRSISIKPEEISMNSADEEFLKKIIQIVESHIDETDLDVSILEKEMSMGKMTLYRKLTSLTNLSGNSFIRNIRLKKAAQFLSSGHYNISEVAYRVGFKDPAYFTRCFKKEFGKSPSDFIIEVKEG